MIQLPLSAKAWGKSEFPEILAQEITSIPIEQLLLHQAMVTGNYVSDEPLTIMILRSEEYNDAILLKLGCFFSSVIAGCNCSDDPTPVDTNNEYAELLLTIRKDCGDTKIQLVE